MVDSDHFQIVEFFWRPGVRERLEQEVNLVHGKWPNWDHLQCSVPLTPKLIDVTQVSSSLWLRLLLKDPLPMSSVLGLAWVARMEKLVEAAEAEGEAADRTLQGVQTS